MPNPFADTPCEGGECEFDWDSKFVSEFCTKHGEEDAERRHFEEEAYAYSFDEE